ncbi:hypothetical protein [Clostridium estertheticum]|uniref:hypothetical protein n=1 Tax=Clostridium estertheticum TaxID=238834 RepID=UPI001CF5E0BC|nr:hypothetical protein [Clostridium estertheticum]MCB2362348.1 hypothetical protein [Clostridium estertheticum]
MNKFTDSHVHFGEKGNFHEMIALKELVIDLKDIEIEKVFIFPITSIKSKNIQMYNAIKEFPNTFIPFVYLNPCDKNALSDFDNLITNYNFKGLKLHPYVGKYRIDDFNLIDLLIEKAMEYNSHIIVHQTIYIVLLNN